MDTTHASPKQTSKVPSLLGIALSAATALWLVAMTSEMASAQTPPQPSQDVTYADLDLSTADGARTLLRRIDLAAKRICGPEPVRTPLLPRAMADYDDCVAASVDMAAAKVGSPAALALKKEYQSPGSAVLAVR